MKDQATENQVANSNAAANSGGTSEGVASMSAPPFSIQSGDDDGSLNIMSNDGQKNDEAEETAGRVIEDAGGIENLNYLFGANFGQDYEDFITRTLVFEDDYQSVLGFIDLPQGDKDELDMEYSKTLSVDKELTNIVFDNAHLEEIDEDTAAYANELLTEGITRMNLVEATYEFYMIIEADKIAKYLKGIKDCMLKGIENIKKEIEGLENDLISIRNVLLTAKKDCRNAGIETVLDAALAGVGIGLVVCGAMTPGLNGVLFLSGLAAGALLARSDQSGVPGIVSVGTAKGSLAAANIASKGVQDARLIPTSIKDPKLLLEIAKGEAKAPAGGLKTVPILNGALSILDFKLNLDEWSESEEILKLVQTKLRNTVEKIDTKMRTILLIEMMLKNMDVYFHNLDTALTANEGKLDRLITEIAGYNGQLGQ